MVTNPQCPVKHHLVDARYSLELRFDGRRVRTNLTAWRLFGIIAVGGLAALVIGLAAQLPLRYYPLVSLVLMVALVVSWILDVRYPPYQVLLQTMEADLWYGFFTMIAYFGGYALHALLDRLVPWTKTIPAITMLLGVSTHPYLSVLFVLAIFVHDAEMFDWVTPFVIHAGLLGLFVLGIMEWTRRSLLSLTHVRETTVRGRLV
jgi:hypothetical protein